MMFVRWHKAALCGVLFSSLLGAFVNVGSHSKQDRAWKHYSNPDLGYCVNYPSRWARGDAFEGAGLFVKSGSGAIDFSALRAAQDDAARLSPIDLSRNLQEHLDGLQKFERAERIEFLEKREMRFLGYSALFTKNRYYDPQDRGTWVEEIMFVNRNNTLYRLELQCRADQIDRFEPVFTYLVGTFQFDCSGQ